MLSPAVDSATNRDAKSSELWENFFALLMTIISLCKHGAGLPMMALSARRIFYWNIFTHFVTVLIFILCRVQAEMKAQAGELGGLEENEAAEEPAVLPRDGFIEGSLLTSLQKYGLRYAHTHKPPYPTHPFIRGDDIIPNTRLCDEETASCVSSWFWSSGPYSGPSLS